MKIGLIDIDQTKFPTLTLMKLSAWHKAKGDEVELITADDVLQGNLFGAWDKVYASCIFDWNRPIAEKLAEFDVEIGGSGWDMSVKLPDEIEHIYPDYSLFDAENTAYGFLSRGCPRACPFCVVKNKEGVKAVKVADLKEFWHGQKNIEIHDPNILACEDYADLLKQLADSKANVNISQGIDVRLLTDKNIELLNQIKIKTIYFAWDNPRSDLKKYFEFYNKYGAIKSDRRKMVFVLANYWSTLEQDLERIYWLRDNGYDPYLTVYDLQNAPKVIKRLRRWVNNKILFRVCTKFEDYKWRKA